MSLKFDFSWLHATQTSYGIVYLEGTINEYLSINYYQSLERGRKDQYQLKTKTKPKQTNQQTNKPTETVPLQPWLPVPGRGGGVVMQTVMAV